MFIWLSQQLPVCDMPGASSGLTGLSTGRQDQTVAILWCELSRGKRTIVVVRCSTGISNLCGQVYGGRLDLERLDGHGRVWPLGARVCAGSAVTDCQCPWIRRRTRALATEQTPGEKNAVCICVWMAAVTVRAPATWNETDLHSRL
jgi:hypothetical protein